MRDAASDRAGGKASEVFSGPDRPIGDFTAPVAGARPDVSGALDAADLPPDDHAHLRTHCDTPHRTAPTHNNRSR
ncbi:hypothetical protein ACIBCP_22335 [Streptomyces sp. NPDC051287]|uniref:hypothetical protein n=1 Tax=Streptomyces sp. NPDC051287 TaxID=3365648 RepID=UPI00379347DC